MDDLISRSALLKLYADTEDIQFAVYNVPIPVVRQNILDAPAVDAVEVVRCAECRYLKTCNRTIELIPRQAQIGYLRCVVHSCEYGERRDTHDE